METTYKSGQQADLLYLISGSKFTKKNFNVENDSYLMISCVSGEGTIEGEKISRGDTFFVPAGMGEIEVSTDGEMEIITVRT